MIDPEKDSTIKIFEPDKLKTISLAHSHLRVLADCYGEKDRGFLGIRSFFKESYF